MLNAKEVSTYFDLKLFAKKQEILLPKKKYKGFSTVSFSSHLIISLYNLLNVIKFNSTTNL